jgi:hypothetical protein
MVESHPLRAQGPVAMNARRPARRSLAVIWQAGLLAAMLALPSGCTITDSASTGLRTGGAPSCDRNGDVDERRAC